jgi:2-polyprenyl-3-methyl-5-hydroxy-6-metoxy-1,4-benzoquinol methylase
MQAHWDKVYSTKGPDEVSWYRPHLERSLALIRRAVPNLSARIIDVGAGASTLVDDLLQFGYADITVLDISESAIAIAKNRLSDASRAVRWLCADVTKAELPPGSFDIWHDRAVFHFLTAFEDRQQYVRTVAKAVKPGGHVIVSTFGPQGPVKCSGLDVMRYSAEELHDEFGGRFELVESSEEVHQTPFGTTQQFLYCYCRFDR